MGSPVEVMLGLLFFEETPPDNPTLDPVMLDIIDALDCNDFPKNSDWVSDWFSRVNWVVEASFF